MIWKWFAPWPRGLSNEEANMRHACKRRAANIMPYDIFPGLIGEHDWETVIINAISRKA